MPSDPQQWINIRDFSPGIRHRITAPGGTPPGAADDSATVNCIALPGGGLGPLPKMVGALTKPALGGSAPADSQYRISGFHVTGPVQSEPYTSNYTGDDNVEMHFAFEWVDLAGVHNWRWDRHRLWAAGTVDTIEDRDVTHHVSWTTTMQRYRASTFADHRLHEDDPTQLGDIYVGVGWSPDDMSATENVWLLFPDPDAKTTLSNYNILDYNEVSLLVSHQGRLVSLDRHVFQHGNAGYWVTNDQFIWTQVNLRAPLSDGVDLISIGTFSQGTISGFGAMGTVSAQELLVVKHRGGGLTISGDLDDPTVYSLPGVVGTNGALSQGIYTPIGFIYGVKNGGVYSWGGGDNSQKLSEFLDDDFWQMKPADWVDFYGKFEVFRNWVLVPNNYIYDTTTESWWKIETATPVFQWAVSPQNSKFYGAPVDFAADGNVAFTFDYDTKNETYSWQSHYLAPSVDRKINVREITFRAMPSGENNTVTLTLVNQDGETDSWIVTLDDTDMPKLHRLNLGFQGQGIKLKIEADGVANEAPVILEVNLGYMELSRTGRTESA